MASWDTALAHFRHRPGLVAQASQMTHHKGHKEGWRLET
jgi:hypothetical protein